MAGEKKGFVNGFKEFIMRGNAVDLAVGMVIGAAFTGIITALVEKVLNPLIGAIFGKPNFDNVLTLTIGSGENAANIMFGTIITAVVNFILVGLALYVCVIVPMNKLNEMQATRKPVEEPEATGPTEAELLTEIRDLLATKTA